MKIFEGRQALDQLGSDETESTLSSVVYVYHSNINLTLSSEDVLCQL